MSISGNQVYFHTISEIDIWKLIFEHHYSLMEDQYWENDIRKSILANRSSKIDICESIFRNRYSEIQIQTLMMEVSGNEHST